MKRVSNLLATPEAKHDVNGGSIKRCTITNLVNFTIWGLGDAYLRSKIVVNSQGTTSLKIEKQFTLSRKKPGLISSSRRRIQD